MISSFESQWDTWREAILAECHRLQKPIQDTPMLHDAMYHPLDRPGLLLDCYDDCPPMLCIRAPSRRPLNVIQDPKSYRLTGFYEHPDNRKIHVHARLNRSWAEQPYHLQLFGEQVFDGALASLEAATLAFTTATPYLAPNMEWRHALQLHLTKSNSAGWVDAKHWTYWVQQWGDASMISSLELTNALLPPGSPAWRANLLQLWGNEKLEESGQELHLPNLSQY